jgi:hypothetical protein
MPVYLETYPVATRVDERISRNREVLLHLAMECLERWKFPLRSSQSINDTQ